MLYRVKTLEELKKDGGPDWVQESPKWVGGMEMLCGKYVEVHSWVKPEYSEWEYTLLETGNGKLGYNRKWFVEVDYRGVFDAL